MIFVKDVEYYYKISCFNLNKKKDEKSLVIDSFEAKKGEKVALVGLNGSGKSTFFKLLIGILKPNKGKICANGLDPWLNRKKYVKDIGVVWGHRSTLWWDLPVYESLNTLQAIYKIPKCDFDSRLQDYVSTFDCSNYLHLPLRKLSLGQRVKVDIIAALIHNPQILFLDEPFVGLDFKSRKAIISKLDYLINKYAITCLLTSHNIEDIEILCDRICIIDEGRLISNTSKEELISCFDRNYKIEIKKNNDKELIVNDEISTGHIVSIEYNKDRTIVELKIQGEEKKYHTVMSNIFKDNEGILSVIIDKNSLEDIIEEKIIKSKRVL